MFVLKDCYRPEAAVRHAKGCALVYRKPEALLCSVDWPTERLGPRAGSSACAEQAACHCTGNAYGSPQRLATAS